MVSGFCLSFLRLLLGGLGFESCVFVVGGGAADAAAAHGPDSGAAACWAAGGALAQVPHLECLIIAC